MEREIDRVAREVLDFLSRHAPESADQSSIAGEPMREQESLEEEATMGSASGPCITHGNIWHAKCRTHECCIGQQATTCRSLSGFTFIDPPEYQHPDDDYNPYWETNEWVDAAYYEGSDNADDDSDQTIS